jgi:hypothetical protein
MQADASLIGGKPNIFAMIRLRKTPQPNLKNAGGQ